MRDKKRSFWAGLVIGIIAHIFYISGLSLVVPVLFLLFVPHQLLAAVAYARPILFSSAALVLVSVIVLYVYNESVGRTFFSLGVATFVPGLIALLFSIYNKEIIFAFIENYIAGFEMIEPVINSYLEHALPTVWIVTAVYLAVGFVFIYVGLRCLRKESAAFLA